MGGVIARLASLAGLDSPDWIPVFGVAVMAGIAGSVIAYFQDERSIGNRSVAGYLRYCFPNELFQRSTFLDACCSLTIYPLVIMPMNLARLVLVSTVARYHVAALNRALGHRPPDAPLWAVIGVSFVAVLCADFGIFTAHYLLHKSRVLWEFHKMHHSATVLSPFTLNRAHPVEDGLEEIFMHVYFGMLSGTFAYFFGAKPQQLTIFGVGWFVALFLANFHYLRHSHFYLRYPRWLERIFYSPGAHQVHHSMEPQHWDLNFGHTLSIWDHLFGTYVKELPETRSFRIGLSGADPAEYDALWKLYARPFVRIGDMVRREGWLSLFTVRRFWHEPPAPTVIGELH